MMAFLQMEMTKHTLFMQMDYNKVAQFLQGIEKEVNKIGGESNGKEILKNSLLGGKVSV